MELLSKVEGISGPQLNLQEYYMRVLMQYGRDLEAVRKLYQKQKNEPVIPRNLPPVAGKIAWARQLYRRCEAPMKVFKRKPEILKVRLIYLCHHATLPRTIHLRLTIFCTSYAI